MKKFECGQYYPIKTLPKTNGTYIVGKWFYGKWHINMASLHENQWVIHDGGWYGPDINYIKKLFTHWSPVPNPPMKSKKKKAEVL